MMEDAWLSALTPVRVPTKWSFAWHDQSTTAWTTKIKVNLDLNDWTWTTILNSMLAERLTDEYTELRVNIELIEMRAPCGASQLNVIINEIISIFNSYCYHWPIVRICRAERTGLLIDINPNIIDKITINWIVKRKKYWNASFGCWSFKCDYWLKTNDLCDDILSIIFEFEESFCFSSNLIRIIIHYYVEIPIVWISTCF